MHEHVELQAQAATLRAQNAFGRTGPLPRLFDFLLEQSLAGHTPKETEVAALVFGRDEKFDGLQDATVRVYVHKLRRRLEDYYAGPGSHEAVRLAIPKGEYRLAIEKTAAPPALSTPPRSKAWRWLGALLVISLAGNAALVLRHPAAAPVDPVYDAVRNDPVWAGMLEDDLPIHILVGDYYIFGEAGPDREVQRLVREYDINSATELRNRLYQKPHLSGRYVNLDLSYLPIATAHALRNLMPILSRKKQVDVVLTSELTAHTLKSAHIIYIGYLSSLGMLQDLAFANSRFSVGETFDEIVDHQTGTRYISQAAVPLNDRSPYRDYGYLSWLQGPGGNRFLIISGTRDVAVMHMSEVLTDAGKLAALSRATPPNAGFEALYEVRGIDRANIDGRMLVKSALEP
ncbi:MAG: hypothetical protein SXG53_12625 [Pseudomonadota bacterium]|nr:hypothetical protein [Pseudomonadota bacterium]